MDQDSPNEPCPSSFRLGTLYVVGVRTIVYSPELDIHGHYEQMRSCLEEPGITNAVIKAIR